MKKGLLLISLLLFTLCGSLRAQDVDSWIIFDAEGKMVEEVELPAEEEDEFFDEELSVPGQLAEDDDYDENMHLAAMRRFLYPVQEITGKAVGFEKAAVILEVEGYRGVCSGAIVAPYTVLTAAHCISLSPNKVVAAGLPGNPVAKVTGYWLPKEYKEWLEKETRDLLKWSPKYDYAFLRLDKDLGKQTGYFGAKAPKISFRSTWAHKPIYIYALEYLGNEESRRLWKTLGMINEADKFHLTTDLYHSGGSSGAPVVMKNSPSTIVGILIAGNSLNDHATILRITPQIVRKISEYRAAAQQEATQKKEKNHSI